MIGKVRVKYFLYKHNSNEVFKKRASSVEMLINIQRNLLRCRSTNFPLSLPPPPPQESGLIRQEEERRAFLCCPPVPFAGQSRFLSPSVLLLLPLGDFFVDRESLPRKVARLEERKRLVNDKLDGVCFRFYTLYICLNIKILLVVISKLKEKELR